MPHPDFEHAFAAHANVISVGCVGLPSGRVVACDPFLCASALPLAHELEPGRYEVQVRRVVSPDWGARIAGARLVLRPGEPAARYEPAAPSTGGDEHFVVGSGLASYMDPRARDAFADAVERHAEQHPDGDYYTDVLAREFAASATTPAESGKWALHRVPDTDLDVAIFASGLGDGSYASWWGLDSAGNTVSLVTDFGLL